jgi:hypothetical protein
MARIPISALPAASALAEADLFPIVQSGATRRTTIADVVTAVSPSEVGTLAELPDPGDRPVGKLFTTDEEGGTLYVNLGTEWLMIGRAATVTAGEELASAAPSSSPAAIAVNAANTPFRVPELTTASFTMPDRPVRVITSVLVSTANLTASPFTGIASGTGRTTYQIRYTKDGWTNSALAEGRTSTFSLTGFESTQVFSAMLSPAGGSISLAAGDTVQVGLFFQRTDTIYTCAAVYSAAGGLFPWLKVIAG